MKEDDDATLVRRCRDGDRGAFGRLVERYQKPVYNAALRLVRDPEEARDVAQTAFLKVFEHLGDYDPRFKFYSWLYRIAVNESLDALGGRRSRGESEDDKVDESPGPEQQLEGEQMSRAIEEALMHIKPDLRALVMLRHFLHLSYHDMGDILQLPEKTVKSRLYSARQLLRDALRRCGAI